MFEIRGSLVTFAAAVQKIEGLELIDEEELAADEDDKEPVAYLMMPDVRALHELVSLWRRWQRGEELGRGLTPWRDVFALLRDLRSWGPDDRVRPEDGNFLTDEIDGRSDDERVLLEIELVFRSNDNDADRAEVAVRNAITQFDGRIVSRSRIEDITYHAVLAELPVLQVRAIIDRSSKSIAGLDPVMYIRPQSVATSIGLGEPSDLRARADVGRLDVPVLALLDGVPVAAHPHLSQHVTVDDQFGLEDGALVTERTHGTAMASLIIHGDLNRQEAALPRQIHVVPVLGRDDKFPPDQLVVDMIYTAIIAMRSGEEPTAPNVLIVNMSLGNSRRPFHGQLSAWARLLDRLAYRFGILFLVSAGNIVDSFGVEAFATRTAFEDAPPSERRTGVLQALGNIVADRRLLSPAETVNGLTVGASNDDWVGAKERSSQVNIDPYPDMRISNPSSALGPGFARSVKPDILMPGAREHLRVVRNDAYIDVKPVQASRSAGIKVAAPPRDGRENAEGFTNGTSAATALASRTSHRIHDALEAAYGEAFTRLTHRERAVVLKALLVHPAQWPDKAASLIRSTIGPPDGKYHAQQRDNIRRFLGYGFVDGDDAVACAADRATFWAVGTLEGNKTATVHVPVPAAIGGKSQFHALSATLAWFTPVSPGRKSYRAVRLELLEPEEIDSLSVKSFTDQPDANQTKRGTVISRRWAGYKAPMVTADMTIPLSVQRNPDQGAQIDEPVPFALAVTLTMPGVVEIYEQVRQRLAVRQLAPA
ncbi:MAG: S8 family peptidase [Alphaproteobacteria bacterium]